MENNFPAETDCGDTGMHRKEAKLLDGGAVQEASKPAVSDRQQDDVSTFPGAKPTSEQTTSRLADKALDLLDRFEVVVVENAEPANWDDALATFLIAYVAQESSTRPVADASADMESAPGGNARSRPLPENKMVAKMNEPSGYLSQSRTALTTAQPC